MLTFSCQFTDSRKRIRYAAAFRFDVCRRYLVLSLITISVPVIKMFTCQQVAELKTLLHSMLVLLLAYY